MRKHIVAVGVLLIIAGIFFHSLFVPSLKIFSFPDYGQSDLWQQTYPAKFFLAESLKNGELPLWNPYIGNGYPEFAKAEIGALYLPNMLFLFLLPFPIAINMLYITTFLISSISMYFLALRLRLQPRAALLSAVVFSYSTFFLTKFPHLSRIESASLLPLLILVLDYLLKKPSIKIASIFALIAAQQIYAGHFQMIFITWLTLSMYTLYTVYFSRKFRSLLYVGGSIVLLGLIASIQLIPSVEFIQSTARGAGFSPQQSLLYSFPWKNLATMLNPFIFGSPHNGTFPFDNFMEGNIFWENNIFIGLPALLLVIFSFLSLRFKKNTHIFFLVFLCFTSIFLMTGKYSPFYFIHSIKPFSFFRAPSKYSIMLIFSLSLLAGYGVQSILFYVQKKKVTPVLMRGLFLILFISTVIQLYQFHTSYSVTDSPKNLLQPPPLADQFFGDPQYRYVSYGSAVPWNHLFVNEGWQDMTGFNYLHAALVPNINVLHRYRSFDSYRILLTKRSQTALSLSDTLYGLSSKNEKYQEAFNNYLDMQSISMIVGPDLPTWVAEPDVLNAPEMYTKKKLPELVQVKRETPAPRFHFAPHIYYSQTVNDITTALEDPLFDASTSAFVEEKFENVGPTSVPKMNILQDSPTHISVSTEVTEPILFVMTDTFYRGWKAYVDEKETTIYPVNINQRGIWIPAGAKKIEVIYQPESFALGKKITVLGYLIIGLLIVYSLCREVSSVYFAKR